MSNRNYLYVEGYKFGFHKFLSNAKKRWRCVNRHCYSYIKTDLNNVIVDFRLDHMHDSNPELVRAKKMNDTVLTHTVRWENRQVCINNLLETLFGSQTMTDVTILCGSQRLTAHRFILSASSDYFHRCFANLFASDHPVLILKEVPYRHMKLLLEFMYKGSLSLSKTDYEAMKKSAKYLEINSFLNYALSNVKKEPVETTQQVVDHDPMIVENNHDINSNDSTPVVTNVHSTKQRFVDNNTHKIFDSSEVTLLSIKTQNPEANKFRSLLEESPSVEILRPQSVQTNQMIAQEEERLQFNNEEEPLMPVVEIVEEPSDFNFDSNFMTSDDKCVVNSKCVHCNEEFVDDYNLNLHLKKAHEKIYKPFTCEFCHINFTRSSHLQRHRRQHTGERPFVCDVCGRAFARGDKLKHHFKTAHADIEYVPKTKRHRTSANSDGLLTTQQLNVNIPTNSAAKDTVSVPDPSPPNDQISPSSSTSSQTQLNSLSTESGNNFETVNIKQEAVSDSETNQDFQDNQSNTRSAAKLQKGRGERKRPYSKINQDEYGLPYFFTQPQSGDRNVDMVAEADGDSYGDDSNEDNQMNGNSSIIETNPMANFMIEPNIEITTDNKIINPV